MNCTQSHSIIGVSIASIFSVWGMILRVKTFVNRELWLDEIRQLGFTLEHFRPIWLRDDPTLDITSYPGDYLLTYPFIKLFGTDKLAAIPHAMITVLDSI